MWLDAWMDSLYYDDDYVVNDYYTYVPEYDINNATIPLVVGHITVTALA